MPSQELIRFWHVSTIMLLYILFQSTKAKNTSLRLVFTCDGVVVRVVIRMVERYDLVKIKLTESEAEH